METIKKLNRSKWTLLVLTGGMFSLMLALNILTPYICDDFTYNLNFSTKEPLGSFLEIFESMYAHSYKMNGRLISPFPAEDLPEELILPFHTIRVHLSDGSSHLYEQMGEAYFCKDGVVWKILNPDHGSKLTKLEKFAFSNTL